MDNQNTYSQESRGVAMNIFAVLGFIAILLAGLWATIQLVKQVSHFSLDSIKKPAITLPSFGGDTFKLADGAIKAQSGKNANLTWRLGKNLKKDSAAVVNFSYACKQGAYIKVADTTGAYKAIPCNAPYTVPASDEAISLIPVISNNSITEIPFALALVPTEGDSQSINSTITISDNAPTQQVVLPTKATSTVTVAPHTSGALKGSTSARKVVTAPVKTVTKPTTVKRTVRKLVPVRKSDPNGMPDLSVKILGVSNVGAKTVVRFEVANNGTKVAKGWTFTATLPTEPAYTYVSEIQPTLYAGERAELRMSFDQVKSGANPLLITVDAQNAVAESVETNNAVSYTIVK